MPLLTKNSVELHFAKKLPSCLSLALITKCYDIKKVYTKQATIVYQY